MKLRNKTTGEIGNLVSTNWNETALTIMDKDEVQLAKYTSLAELNTEWEDYEEPKTFFTIYYDGTISEFKGGDDEQIRDMKEIGNYFDTREEAEEAVEKLKAWKRLKDKGLKSFSSHICGDDFVVNFKLTNHVDYSQSIDDFDCIFDFGGEE